MFIKKDIRKIPRILQEAVDCPEDDSVTVTTTTNPKAKKPKQELPLTSLRLGRRTQEFQGSVSILCRQPKEYRAKLQCLQSLNLYDCGIANLDDLPLLFHSEEENEEKSNDNGDSMMKVDKISQSSDGPPLRPPPLQTLHLGRNPLMSIPRNALTPPLQSSLKELWLDDCQLTNLDAVCCLTQLQELRCPNNQLTSIPRALVEELTHLQVLCIDGNPLGGKDGDGTTASCIPQDWSSLTQLKTLYARCCHWTQLPERLPTESLRGLYVSSNQLTDLSKKSKNNLEDCHELTHLVLHGNQLEALPSSLEDWEYHHPQLQYVSVSHNPPLTDLCESMWKEIEKQEQQQQNEEEESSNQKKDDDKASAFSIVWQPNENLTLPEWCSKNVEESDDDDDDTASVNDEAGDTTMAME